MEVIKFERINIEIPGDTERVGSGEEADTYNIICGQRLKITRLRFPNEGDLFFGPFLLEGALLR